MSQTPTPHIEAAPGDFAATVLMPGDPLRAQHIAKTYLKDVRQVNKVRGMNGYTGVYKGKPVSVMASGMGIPSIGIYSYELFHFYEVKNIIRIGTAGAISPDLKIRDVVIGMGACTDSNFAAQYELPGTFAPIASFDLLRKAVSAAEAMPEVSYKVGNLVSSDVFYGDRQTTGAWQKMGVLAVEMEAAGLYMNAARAGANALAICTVSDSMVTGEATTAQERESGFENMVKIALEIA